MIDLIRVARAVCATCAVRGHIPEVESVRDLQIAAFDAGGLPRLVSDLLTCYTGMSQSEDADDGHFRYRLIDDDVRLIMIVSRAAGFRLGRDMRWSVNCLGELAVYARAIEGGCAADDWPVAFPQEAASGVVDAFLHRMGDGHLVSGRLNPMELRLGMPHGSSLPAARLQLGAVEVLAAISRDAVLESQAWPESVCALSQLGMSPERAAKIFTAVGPLIVDAARMLKVRPEPEMSDRAWRPSSIGDSAGVVLAICDLVAVGSLYDR
jgi:hypothetical protein